MASRKIEEEIAKLGTTRDVVAVRKGLKDRVGLVVAKAAKVAAESRMFELVPDLVAAFDRLFDKPAERDRQCWGKNAIARALMELEHRESAVFLRGARHVQMEPVWGGQEDTAAAVRGACMLGLVTCSDIRRETILQVLVEGVTDPAVTVRVDAVRALAEMGGDEAPLLLRLKARAGDMEPPVIGQVFDSLLMLEGRAGIDFIASFLQGRSGEVQAEAALALGSSRLSEGVEALEKAWGETRDPDLRDAIARAISTSRQERGFAFLLEVVKNGRAAEASTALDALAIHRESPEVWKRVEDAVEEAGTAVQERFRNLTAAKS